ncbi:MAG: right-handed parallel beta-helix repeat-containing protein, partial [Rhizobacter sp.]|nr:right-handed parallel beta-helix repeat-containing protein [Rhizobacter sp.]
TPAPPLPPAPPPAPPITPAGPVYYFSDCQAGAAAGCVTGNNSNAGTGSAAPKRDLSGFNVNTLPAGAQLLFQRGGAWNWVNVRLENNNVTPAQPMVIDAYGSGERPLFRVNLGGASAIDFGNYNNTSNDGGYTLRNVKLDGLGSSATGLFLIHNLRHVTIESTEITGFHIAIHAQSRAPHGVTNVLIRNNSISGNTAMGILGQLSDSVIEGNQFHSNNYISGSGFNHGTYLSGNADGGRNIVLRNNRYTRNSALNGVCLGGNMTFHGQLDGVLIEGNTIEQDAATAGCWLMSITQGYDTAEWFRNFVVRGNRLINGGNTAIAVQSAPGIVLEDNLIINTQASYQTGINASHNEYQNGDVPDGNAVVRNNTACYPTPANGSSVAHVTAPNSQVSNNVTLTGPDASSGVCAR